MAIVPERTLTFATVVSCGELYLFTVAISRFEEFFDKIDEYAAREDLDFTDEDASLLRRQVYVVLALLEEELELDGGL